MHCELRAARSASSTTSCASTTATALLGADRARRAAASRRCTCSRRCCGCARRRAIRGLIDPRTRDEPSAKFDALLPQLREVRRRRAQGAGLLAVHQPARAAARAARRARASTYEYLDGRTRDRAGARSSGSRPIRTCALFLISLKAGGLGLNLTAAEYVFLLDPWWNPAVEAQAIDRAHRIGQTRHVFAYRLLATRHGRGEDRRAAATQARARRRDPQRRRRACSRRCSARIWRCCCRRAFFRCATAPARPKTRPTRPATRSADRRAWRGARGSGRRRSRRRVRITVIDAKVRGSVGVDLRPAACASRGSGRTRRRGRASGRGRAGTGRACRISHETWLPCAPSAMRTPISAVRCVTE